MTEPQPADRYWAFALLPAFIASAIFYFAQVPAHPPGFYIDESSIAYNAHTISQTGRDEYGNEWPLFFRAFGEYKNPTFIYLLAAVFRVTGPSIAVARLLSASLGLVASLLLGLLAWRITRGFVASVLVAIAALLTPWLFESSRLVFEIAIYPCLLAIFLLALQSASAKRVWTWIDVAAVASTLALLTYSYSIGRLLGPLLTVGLGLFITRHRWVGVIKTWLIYAIMLVPLVIFHLQHPRALSGRFELLTYVTPQSSAWDSVREFVRHYLGNLNPWRWLVTGETNIRDHVPGTGSVLVGTILLGVIGLVLVWRNHRGDAWWRFVLYGLLMSVVPASLTRNEFPQLRLIAFPIFFLILTIPGIVWLLEECRNGATSFQRSVLAGAFGLMVIQGAYFQWLYHEGAPGLWYVFDARFPRKVLATALATGSKPIYLVDEPGKSGYIQTLWYGVLSGLDPTQTVRLAIGSLPPPGAVVISSAEKCDNCRLIARSLNYIVYGVLPYDGTATAPKTPLPEFRASIIAQNAPVTVRAGEKATLNVIVKNIGLADWPAVGEFDGAYAVTVRNRWRKSDGTVLGNDDGIKAIPFDLAPDDTAGVSLEIRAPEDPGDYILELDLVQEGVTWFGDRGSQSVRASLRVVSRP